MYQLRQSVFIHLSRFSLGNNCNRIINFKSNELRRKGVKAYIYIYIYIHICRFSLILVQFWFSNFKKFGSGAGSPKLTDRNELYIYIYIYILLM